MSRDGLPPKQQLFVDYYITDFNGTQAAIKAGYSEKTARQIASELLTKPDIQETVQAALQALRKRAIMGQDEVLERLTRMARLDPRKMFDADGKPIPLHKLDDEMATCIAGLDVLEEKVGGEVIGATKKYKFTDPQAALDKMGKYHGLWVDRSEVSLLEAMTPEQRKKRIEELNAKKALLEQQEQEAQDKPD